MRYVFAVLLVLISVALTAQVGMNMNTPEGSVSMSVTGMPNGNPLSDQNTIDQIVSKLDMLQKDYLTKLTKLDQKRADKIMNEIYDLLATLSEQNVAPVASASSAASASSSSSSSSSSTSSGTANININIAGMEGQDQPNDKPHHNDNDRPQGHNNPPEHHEQMGPKPMPASDFNALINQIKSESFSDDQMRVIRTAAKNYNFDCNQIVRVIECFTFSADKISALGITYPKVIDPKNNYTILDSFTYSSDKADAEEIMNR
jgi:hypothetical protein